MRTQVFLRLPLPLGKAYLYSYGFLYDLAFQTVYLSYILKGCNFIDKT